MSHTNSTTNYNLPQFLTTDKPAWLTDINGAFSDIDTAIHTAQGDATTAGNNATQALSDASAASTAAATADAKGAGAVASIADTFDSTTVYSVGDYVMYNSLLYRCSVAVITPGPWTGSTNWTRTTVETIIPKSAQDLPITAGSATTTASAISSKPNITVYEGVYHTNNSSIVDSTALVAGGISVSGNYLCAPVSDAGVYVTVYRYSNRYTFEFRSDGTQALKPDQDVFIRVAVLST